MATAIDEVGTILARSADRRAGAVELATAAVLEQLPDEHVVFNVRAINGGGDGDVAPSGPV